MFEYVYLARPDSIMDGVSVYEARLKMGEFLAEKMKRAMPHVGVDVVIPIPDSSRPSALEMALRLGLPYREGFVKNRYIGRTFIMPGQSSRKKSVRQKLNTIHQEFQGKSVLLVDDSIVRGTTSREIINMAREAGARRVYMASAAPPVRYANVYGIDMPTRSELIANERDEAEICRVIGADGLLYQELGDLKAAVRALNPTIQLFETSCFDGCYITGDITAEYLSGVENLRGEKNPGAGDGGEGGGQLDLNLIDQGE
jgi:amidophosphoribosyltransferase